VTSKGGVTIEAIKVLKGQDIQNLIHIALGKAMERSIEMSHSF
jgi:pyrroline-5-carboxylate reductase